MYWDVLYDIRIIYRVRSNIPFECSLLEIHPKILFSFTDATQYDRL